MIELHKIGFIIDQLRQTVVLFEELYGSEETVSELNRTSVQSLSKILNKMISIIAMAGSLYNGPDKDQFLHRKTKMPDTAGGKQLIQKLKIV